ncbi:MAG: DEAD/DEAH box helicase [Verrucomicrobia bacterium]|nr:DEAD/DEAH box helicase [Verrucomicrobiota bacterium]
MDVIYNIDSSLSRQHRTIVFDKPSRMQVKPLESYILLQKLAGTQKLFLDGKRVVCDFFSKLTLEYLVEETTVHALLKNKELNEYLILQGSPQIAILGNFIYFLEPNIGWQDIAPFLNGPKTMTRDEYVRFKKETDPALIVEFDAPKQAPRLQVVDASCSFAYLENSAHEKELQKAGFSKKDLGKSNYYCPTDRSQSALLQLIESGWDVRDEKGQPIIRCQEIILQENDFRVSGHFTFGDQQLEVKKVATSLQKNERLLPLENGSTALLAFDSETKGFLEQIELVGMRLKKSHIAATNPTLLSETLRAVIEPAKRIECKPSSDFKGTLRPYQQEGLNWLVSLYKAGLSGLLADEMGLGKTVQVLAFLSLVKGKVLIVVPTSLICNWQREIEQFLPSRSDIEIISYGKLRKEPSNQEYECVILDEAQNIKNSSTITHQAVLQLKSRFRLSLTGTPVENSSQELINQFRFLEPGLIFDESPSALRKAIAPFFLRRKKADVAKDLPERIDEIVYVSMTEDQQRIYNNFMANLKAGLLKKIDLEGTKACRMEIFEALLRLRQIACHPALVPQLGQAGSGKFGLVLEDLETLISEGKKVLLFSQFTSMLHLFSQEATKRGWGHLLLEGKTQNRQELVDRFQNDPNYPLFFISLKAGGVGLNLTRADYVLLYDPWWNRAQEAQAIDRAHRIGRTGTVFSKRYYVAGSIEEKILALQNKKSDLAEILLEDDGAVTPQLDDLHELLT